MRTRKNNKWTKVVIPCPNCGCGCDVNLSDSDEEDIISISSDSDPEFEPEPVRKRARREVEQPESPPSSVDLEPKIEPKAEPLSQSNIQTFFSQFSKFKYEPSQPIMPQFQELCETHFPPASQQLHQARRDFKDALVLDFNALYGTDVNDLGAWQSLCRVLRFSPVPDDLEACQGVRAAYFSSWVIQTQAEPQLVEATYVNIVDLIETELTGNPVQHFDSEKELASYTRATKKFLPRNHPRAGGFLKFLLRDIFCPGAADRGNPDPLRGLARRR